ncbi:MAG: glutathione-disulfide reductase, partial [Pseudomonadales bacterium]|nr:glutathione-disulfide reductase [Pseudomonadales bacterium]
MIYDFDLYVIGAGSGGVRASRMAAGHGARVAVAESTYLGGTCVNVGCVPKKLFVYGSHYAEDIEDAHAYGWREASAGSFHWPTLRDNKSAEIERLNGVYRGLLDGAGITLHEGRAVLLDAHTIALDGQTFTAQNILVATGSWPFVPEFPGREHVITSNDAFYLPEFPKRAVVVGGGYIAVEFAGIFAGLGAETELVYRGPMFLRGFDDTVREFVAHELREKGISLCFERTVERISLEGDQRVLEFDDASTTRADLVLYATGRRPNSVGLGLEQVGVELSETGAVLVDEHFRTNVPNIYAIGDVIDRVQLTPVAIAEGMVLSANLFTDAKPRSLDYENIATAVFCQPNIGTVGLTEVEARVRFDEISVFESRFRPMKHALTGREERTLMKLIVNPQDDKV